MIIVYELNELPPKLLEIYCNQNPESYFAQLVETYYSKTIVEASGELHPWSTWPSVHRGAKIKEHNIKFLGQNLTGINVRYPAIWTRLVKARVTVGIFGCLQSYPPEINQYTKFFVGHIFTNSDNLVQIINTFPRF